MGCSWFTYEGTLHEIKEGWLLIPEYAQEWAGTDKLKVKRGGDYSDFEMAETPHEDKSLNFLDGHVLIGVFIKLYNGENVDVTLKDCYFKGHKFPYDNEPLEDLRSDGIFSHADYQYTPYSLKITKDDSLTYETCKYYSPSGQNSFMSEDDPDYEDEYEDYTEEELENMQKTYNEYWEYYFGHIQ